MRRTIFGEPVLQPDDEDVTIPWIDQFGDEPDRAIARFIEEDDGVWGCEIHDNNDDMISVNDFPTRDALVGWLERNGIEVEN
jgi:hypothetical protein